MIELENKRVLVIGLCERGRAACALLRRRGARVTGLDCAQTPRLAAAVEGLTAHGIEVLLDQTLAPKGGYDLAVISPAVPLSSPVVEDLRAREIPLMGELELGYQHARCLTVGIGGTNGKGVTAELIEGALTHAHRKAVVAGNRARPACAVAEESRDLDYLILQANALQLESCHFFRPAVSVLMNLAPDHLERFPTPMDYARANAHLFQNQQPFDWAVVQSEALQGLRELGFPIAAKTITFSATTPDADIYLDRGLLISRLPDWEGPLLNLEHCQLRGPHNAENLMAALAVGRILRLSLDETAAALKTCPPRRHRFELIGEFAGVQFINDSKATNAHALRQALLGTRLGEAGTANVWLIAGGQSGALDFHDLGPLLSRRVKRVFLIGQDPEMLHAAWGLFTPCTVSESLLEAVAEAAKSASPGDVILLSPACSSFDQFRDYKERGEVFCQAVKSISGGVAGAHPNMMVSLRRTE